MSCGSCEQIFWTRQWQYCICDTGGHGVFRVLLQAPSVRQVSPWTTFSWEAWLFNHGWRPRSILSRVLWQMLESAPQQVDTHEEDHHLEPSSQSEIWEVYGIRYTVIYSQKDICKIKILVLTLWMLPHVSCFAAVLPCKCHEQKALKKLRPCEVPHRFRDLIVGRCHFFLSLFFSVQWLGFLSCPRTGVVEEFTELVAFKR